MSTIHILFCMRSPCLWPLLDMQVEQVRTKLFKFQSHVSHWAKTWPQQRKSLTGQKQWNCSLLCVGSRQPGMVGGLFGREKIKFRIKINSWTQEHTVDVLRGGEFGDTALLKRRHWACLQDCKHTWDLSDKCDNQNWWCNWVQWWFFLGSNQHGWR